MLDNMVSVALQVLILFVMIATGFVLTKFKILTKERVSGLVDIVIYVVTPSNIIVSFQREYQSELLSQLLLAFLMGIGMYFISCMVAKLLIHDKNKDKGIVIEFGAGFPNVGYFGLPLQQALLGDIGVFFGVAYIAMFHSYVWTYGVRLLNPKKEKINFKKILLNPPIIGIVIGLITFVTQCTLPSVIVSPLRSFSYMNSTLPMLVVGYYLANTDLKSTFTNIRIYIGSISRLVLVPLITIGMCLLFNASKEAEISCVIASACPTAAMSGMLAMKFGRDTEVSAAMISLTTIMCIVTLPVLVALAQTIL